MKRIISALLALLLTVSNATALDMRAGGTPIPAPARAAGFLTHTLAMDHNFTTSTVDMGMTYVSGFKFFVWKFFGATPALNGTVLNGDGSISVGVGPGNGEIVSAAPTGTAPYFIGKAYGGGGYFEATFALNTFQANSGTYWPSWWTMAIEHLANLSPGNYWQYAGLPSNYQHFIENDIFELIPPTSTETYVSTLHDWFGVYNVTCAAYCVVNSNDYGPTVNVSHVPHGTNFLLPHRVGMLWIPATPTASGSISYYFDDIQVAQTVTYTQFTTQGPPATTSTPWTFGVIDQQHIALIFGGGGVIGNINPLIVSKVDVWQASDANNISN